MKAHLSDEQLADWLAAEADASTDEHLQQCSQCRMEVEQLRPVLVRFRQATRSATAAIQPEVWAPPALSRPSSMRWSFAAVALVLLALVLLLPTAPRPTGPSQVAVKQDNDEVLFMKIEADMRRAAPSALQPAALIVSERNRLALKHTSYSQGEIR